MNSSRQQKIPTFEEIFLSLEPDILSGVLKHFCRRNLSEDEIEGNMKAIFYFFVVNGRVHELMEWITLKEIAEVHNPNLMFQRNSIYNRIIRLYMDFDIKDVFQESVDKLVEKISKKALNLNLLDSSTKYSQNDLKKVQKALNKFFSKIFDSKLPEFDCSFKYFISSIGAHITEVYPTATINVLINIIFNRYLGSLIATSKPTKNVEKTTSALKSVSLIIKWMLANELKEDCSWHLFFKDFAEIVKTNVVSWITNNVIHSTTDQKPKVKWEVAVKITKDIKNMVFKESEQICSLLPETTSRVLRLLKDEYISSTTSMMDLLMKLQVTITEQQSDIFSLYSEIAVLNQRNKELEERIKYYELRKRKDDDVVLDTEELIQSVTPMLKIGDTAEKQSLDISTITSSNKQKLDAFFAKRREQEKLNAKNNSRNSIIEAKGTTNLSSRPSSRVGQYIATPFATPGLGSSEPKNAFLGLPFALNESKEHENDLGISLFSEVLK